MSNILTYKGYLGSAVFDAEAGIFHGEVLGTRDVITFQGESVKELIQAFHDSVDDYLDYCAERGEQPEKSFSGQFIVRVGPEVHRLVNLAACAAGKSINAWVIETLSQAAETVLGSTFEEIAVPFDGETVAARKPRKRTKKGSRAAPAKRERQNGPNKQSPR